MSVLSNTNFFVQNKNCWDDSRFSESELKSVFSGGFVDKHLCCVCYGVLNDPLECVNGHCIGSICANQLVKQECPVCRVDFYDFELMKSSVMNRVLLGLQIACSNDGCCERVSVARIQKHEMEDCAYRLHFCSVCNRFSCDDVGTINCKLISCVCGVSKEICDQDFWDDHVHFSCGDCDLFVSSREEMEHHVANDCICRLVICEFCKSEVEFSKLQTHQKTKTCEYCFVSISECCFEKHRIRVCFNGCSRDSFVCSNTVKSHKAICPKEVVSCCYASYGCLFRTFRVEMSSHECNMNLHSSFSISYADNSTNNEAEEEDSICTNQVGLKRKRN